MWHRRFLSALIFLVALGGCAGFIKGVTNTNLYEPPQASASYTIESALDNPIIARKIALMLHYQMQKLGFKRDDDRGDIRVSFAFDVVPAGVVSRAYTFLYYPASTSGPTFSTATTTISTTRIFEKSIAVRMADGKTDKVLWEGLTIEEGWCNQIIVTAPAILFVMFKDFPQEQTNVRQMQNIDTLGAKEFKALFPANTDWGCR